MKSTICKNCNPQGIGNRGHYDFKHGTVGVVIRCTCNRRPTVQGNPQMYPDVDFQASAERTMRWIKDMWAKSS